MKFLKCRPLASDHGKFMLSESLSVTVKETQKTRTEKNKINFNNSIIYDLKMKMERGEWNKGTIINNGRKMSVQFSPVTFFFQFHPSDISRNNFDSEWWIMILSREWFMWIQRTRNSKNNYPFFFSCWLTDALTPTHSIRKSETARYIVVLFQIPK